MREEMARPRLREPRLREEAESRRPAVEPSTGGPDARIGGGESGQSPSAAAIFGGTAEQGQQRAVTKEDLLWLQKLAGRPPHAEGRARTRSPERHISERPLSGTMKVGGRGEPGQNVQFAVSDDEDEGDVVQARRCQGSGETTLALRTGAGTPGGHRGSSAPPLRSGAVETLAIADRSQSPTRGGLGPLSQQQLNQLLANTNLSQLAASSEEIKELLEEVLAGGREGRGGSSSSAARGLTRKARQESFEDNPEVVFWELREKVKALLRVRPGKSWSMMDWADRIPFGGYRTLERAYRVSAELFEAQALGDHQRAMGLNALWMMCLEEIARGSS